MWPHRPSIKRHCKWTTTGRRGIARPLLLGAVGSWVRLHGVWNQAHVEAWIKALSQRVHVRHSKCSAIYFSGEIEGVCLILLEDISLCAVAHSLLLPSPYTMHSYRCARTHTQSLLLAWKNALWGAAHPRTQLRLHLQSWWITMGNLKSLHPSDYQK